MDCSFLSLKHYFYSLYVWMEMEMIIFIICQKLFYFLLAWLHIWCLNFLLAWLDI